MTIYQYNISDYDLSTAVLNANTTLLSTTTFSFWTNGNQFMYVDPDTDTLEQYIMSSNNLSSLAFFDSEALPSNTGFWSNIMFRSNGLNYYTVNSTDGNFITYSMSSPFDLSSLTFVSSESLCIFNQCLFFTSSPSGLNILILNNTDETISQFNTSTAYDFSSMNLISSLDIAPYTPTAKWGFDFNNDITRLFLSNGTHVVEFLTTPSQTANLTDISMGFNDQKTRLFSNYFEDYTYPFVRVTDIISGQSFQIGLASQGFGNTGQITLGGETMVSASLSSLQTLTLTSFETNREFNVLFLACADSDQNVCVNDDFTLTIDSSIPTGNLTPTQIQQFNSNYVLGETGSVEFNLNQYFQAGTWNGLNVSFPQNGSLDELDCTNVIPTFTTETSSVNISVILESEGNNCILTIESLGQNYSGTFNLEVINYDDFFNELGSVEVSFNVFTGTQGQATEQTGVIGSLVNILGGLFPDENNLTVTQKILYVVATILLTFILIFLAFLFLSAITQIGIDYKVIFYTWMIFSFLWITLFIAIGYINLLIPILVIAGFLILFFIRRNTP